MTEKVDLRSVLGEERYLKLETLCRSAGGTDEDPRDVIMTTMEISPEDTMVGFEEVIAALTAEVERLHDAAELILPYFEKGTGLVLPLTLAELNGLKEAAVGLRKALKVGEE